MIKGPLGIMVWEATLNDDLAVKPTDLVLSEQEAKERASEAARRIASAEEDVQHLQAA